MTPAEKYLGLSLQPGINNTIVQMFYSFLLRKYYYVLFSIILRYAVSLCLRLRDALPLWDATRESTKYLYNLGFYTLLTLYIFLPLFFIHTNTKSKNVFCTINPVLNEGFNDFDEKKNNSNSTHRLIDNLR